MTRFSKRELDALAEACGFRLAGDTDELTDEEIVALESAHEKILQRIHVIDSRDALIRTVKATHARMDAENPALYDAARDACHAVGVPWTDPRTGITYPPPRREPS